MFPRLGHHPFIGGYYQQGRVDASDPGEHVANKVLMARDIDNAEMFPIGQLQPREAQVDRHLPQLFLHEPIGVDSGERSYQG